MKHLLYICFLSISLYSCIESGKTSSSDLPQVITIDMNNSRNLDFKTICSKIEIVPLETSGYSLVGGLRTIIVTDEFYIISDNQKVVSFFDKEGHFISNSQEKKGMGPEEYNQLLGISYNEGFNAVDIFTPYYQMTYDTCFNLVNKKKLPSWSQKNKKFSQFFYASHYVSPDKSILLPTTLSENPHRIVVYNTIDEKIIQEINYDNDVIAPITGQGISLFPINDSLVYFSPPALSYTHYILNTNSFSTQKSFVFDFGEQNINSEDLKSHKTDMEKNEFLLWSSEKPLPLRTLFNELYISTTIKMKDNYFVHFHFRKTGENYIMKPKESKRAFVFECIKDNVLYSLVQPHNLEEYVDISLADEKNKKIIENIKEDDNPIVVKYYLK